VENDMVARISRVTGIGILVAVVSLMSARHAGAQASDTKIWKGVYSAAQAERGKANFEAACARCHHVALTGTDRAPALKGDNFWSHWENETVNTLFTKVRDQMPPSFGTVLEPEAKLDVVAYLLRTNGLPDGSDELKMNAELLDGIDIVKKGAGSRAANFALVQVVGCLSQADDRAWVLTKSSEPLVTKDQIPTTENLTDVRPRPLGDQTYLLLSVVPFKPDSQAGHKVEARGLLYRAPNDNRLDLTSLRTVDQSCAN
jgi:S-disulfanyl-L-cysteine oxidoreductase SoxD